MRNPSIDSNADLVSAVTEKEKKRVRFALDDSRGGNSNGPLGAPRLSSSRTDDT